MAYKNLILEKKNHICIFTFNHPPVNAWNREMMEDFGNAIVEIENEWDVRVLILTGGKERCFSAGFDVSNTTDSKETLAKGRELWTKIDRFTKPVIAAINGYAMGGGLELAMCCHFRVMVDDPKATMGLTELNLGTIPSWGGTQRLARIVGRAKALDLILFSKRINARQALEIGLIHKISNKEQLMDDAMAYAEILANRPPIALGCALKAVSALEYEGLEEGLKVEEKGAAIVAKSKDRKEGFTAFLEKRAPTFRGE